MTHEVSHGSQERVLVLAPTGRDGALTVDILRQGGFLADECADIQALCRGIEGGAAAVIVAEEALGQGPMQKLDATLARQPPWSDLPVIVFTQQSQDHRPALERGAVTVLDRPIRIGTLLSVVRVVLRARRRQYEVRDLLEQLAESDRRKDEFLAMLGHELRNPLSAIQTASAILDDTVKEPKAVRPREVIRRQVRNLARMVEDLLDVSRITRGKISLQHQVVDLNVIAERCLTTIDQASRQHLQSLVLELHPEPVLVDGDPVRLEQVVCNLVQNALKYTRPGNHVRMKVVGEAESATVVVEDDGIGIEPAMLGRIFDAFIQVDHSLHRQRGGLGLGLPVVRALTEMHGGEVRAYSDGPGKGSTFVLRLPLADAPAHPDTPTPDLAPRPSRAPERQDHEPATVLLVDDDEDIRDLLGELMRRWGYDVRTAANGQEALDEIARSKPRVALVDIGMPIMDGYSAAKRICAHWGKGRPRLVAMTGFGQPEDRQRAFDAGFERHLVKPVDSEELSKVLSELTLA